jgi:hypothetical protein
MKNRYFLWTFSALTVLVGFTACKKDSSGTPSNSSTATISGAAFKSSYTTGVDLTSQNNITLAFLQGKGDDTTVITLSFPDTIQVNKAYKIGGDNTVVSLEYETSAQWFATWGGEESGTMTLSVLNKDAHNVQGTYSGIAWAAGGDSVIIKDGKFNANYLVY